MDIDLVGFVNQLTITQMAIFIIVIQVLEILSGLLRALREGKSIRSSITLESIEKKFNSWKYIFALAGLFIFVGADDLAKTLLGFVLLPDLVSIVENIVNSVMKKEGRNGYDDLEGINGN